MASRSLGSLTLDLIARLGGWKSGLDQAARVADTRSREMEKSFTRLGGVLRTVFGGLTIGLAIRKIVDETSDAQRSLAKLETAIANSGRASSYSIPQIQAMAEEFQNLTTFSDEVVQDIAAILIQFGRLNGPELKNATAAVLDLATFLEKDATTIAIAFGKAMTDPIGKMNALGKAGVILTKVEKEQIKTAKELNGIIGARAKLLEIILSKSPSDAAERLRNTLGGSLTGLKEAFGNLFELDNNATAPLVSAINTIARNLEGLAAVFIRVGAVYLTFKTAILATNLAKAVFEFGRLFGAIAAGKVVMTDAAILEQARIVNAQRAAVVAYEQATAEAAKAGAIHGVNVALAESIALQGGSAVAIATTARNAKGSQKVFEAAVAAQILAAQKVRDGAAGAAVAQGRLSIMTSRLGQAFAALLGPFRGIVVLIAGLTPLGRIALAIGSVVGILAAFADKIKLSADGVVNLANYTKAAFQLIGEAIDPVVDALTNVFKPILEKLRDLWKEFGEAAKFGLEFAKQGLLNIIPGGRLVLGLLENINARIQEQARVIAASEAAAAKARATAGMGEEEEEEEEETVDPDKAKRALERIKGMVQALKEKNVELEHGTLAAFRLSLQEGELAQVFKEAGPAAEQFRGALIRLTEENERLKKATERTKEEVRAREELDKFAQGLEREIALFGKGEQATFQYALAHDDLAKNFKLAGETEEEFRARIVDANRALTELRIAQKLKEMRIEILELRGETEEAIRLRFELDTEGFREDLEAVGGPVKEAGERILGDQEELLVNQDKFNKLREDAARIGNDLARQEERIRNSQEVGAISELGALEQIGEARGDALVQLRETYDELKRISDLIGSDETKEAVAQLGHEISMLGEQTHLVTDQIEKEFKEAFAASFAEFVKGTKTAREAWNSFVDDIRNKFIDRISDMFSNFLFGDMFNTRSGGGSNAGALGTFFSWLGGFFGAPRAWGGPVEAGMIHPINEREPEFFRPNSGGRIIPLSKMGSAGMKVTNYFTLHTPNGTVSRQTQLQIATAVARGAEQAQRRNG